MTSQDKRRHSRFMLAAVVGVPVLLSLGWLWSRPSAPSASHFDETLDRALEPVMQQREVQAKLAAATSRQARLLARELAQGSVHYLAARDLELWAATRLRVARASKLACARLWKGGDGAFLGPAIAALGDDALEAWSEMLARGLAVRLEQKPPPEPAARALQRGFAAALEQLPPEQRAAFELDVKRPDVSNERACELFIALSNGADTLAPALRADFYRALAKELSGTPQER